MEIALIIGNFAVFLTIVLGLIRMMRGPTVVDRILAFDMVAISLIALVVLLSLRWSTALYLELMLIISLLGFVGTVALVFYLQRTYNAEKEKERQEEAQS
ncbi:MAG: hypothetical protein JJT96_14940 [Opitutales bacterium]|nr:hypothetical protein [Opitutales bacterium]